MESCPDPRESERSQAKTTHDRILSGTQDPNDIKKWSVQQLFSFLLRYRGDINALKIECNRHTRIKVDEQYKKLQRHFERVDASGGSYDEQKSAKCDENAIWSKFNEFPKALTKAQTNKHPLPGFFSLIKLEKRPLLRSSHRRENRKKDEPECIEWIALDYDPSDSKTPEDAMPAPECTEWTALDYDSFDDKIPEDIMSAYLENCSDSDIYGQLEVEGIADADALASAFQGSSPLLLQTDAQSILWMPATAYSYLPSPSTLHHASKFGLGTDHIHAVEQNIAPFVDLLAANSYELEPPTKGPVEAWSSKLASQFSNWNHKPPPGQSEVPYMKYFVGAGYGV